MSPSRRRILKFCIIVGCCVTALIAILITFGIPAWRTLLLMQTHNDLKWIGMALHEYHDENGHFPPSLVLDDSGNRLHSWRSLIHPHLARAAKTSDDWSAYRLDEAWNSPRNTAAAKCHRFGSSDYSFLAVVGHDAAWITDGTRQIKDFTDGTSQTVLVIGIKHAGVGWHEPRDLAFDGNNLTLNLGDGRNQSVSLRDSFILTADGVVHYCGDGLPAPLIKSLITINGGDSIKNPW